VYPAVLLMYLISAAVILLASLALSSSYICHAVWPPVVRSGLTNPEVPSKVYQDSFCQLDSSVALPWVIYFEAFYLHVASSFFCTPAICPKLVLFLTPSRSIFKGLLWFLLPVGQ
jgi:hypothetical protein